jgi:hypothetical protein
MNKKWWCVVLISLGLSTGFALASERLDEMVEQIEEQVEDSSEQDLFIDAAEEYIQERDATLTVLAKWIEVNTEGDMQSEWENTVDDLSDVPGLSDISSSLNSDAAKALYDQFMDEEQEWVSALSVLSTAGHRDEIVALKIRLTNMTQKLEADWQKTLNDDGQLDTKELEAFRAVYEIYRGFINDCNASRERFKTAAKVMGEAAAKADKFLGTGTSSETDMVKAVGGAVKEGLDYLLKVESAVSSTLPTLEQYTDAELNTIVLFKKTRDDTELFMRDNNFDKMKTLYSEAEDELEAFAGTGTDAQQDDAEAFVDLVKGLLSKHVSEGEKIFNDFVAKHNLKFFGPIGPDIQENLLERQVWLTKADELRKLDLEEYLRDWRDESKEVIEVNLSLDGISDEERSLIEDALEANINELNNTLSEERFARFVEFFLGPYLASREELAEELE